jgi:hypothetical protein
MNFKNGNTSPISRSIVLLCTVPYIAIYRKSFSNQISFNHPCHAVVSN